MTFAARGLCELEELAVRDAFGPEFGDGTVFELAGQSGVRGTVGNDQDVFSFLKPRLDDFIEERLRSSEDLVHALPAFHRDSIFLGIPEQDIYRAVRDLKGIFDSFVDTKAHLF